jgi:uncharacterized protein (TIGR02646 family)
MLKVTKLEEPEFLLHFKRKSCPQSWVDYNEGTIKREIKEYILKNEQNKYCPYCEKAIYELDECHIEHIKPRDRFPQMFQEYMNLLASCNGKNSCGNWKENSYSEDFINPVMDNPEDYFTFDIVSGKIVPKCKLKDDVKYRRAEYTIQLLNLNCYTLMEARKNLIIILEVYRENYDDYSQYLQYFLDDGQSFPSLIKYYNEELI